LSTFYDETAKIVIEFPVTGLNGQQEATYLAEQSDIAQVTANFNYPHLR
jgi:hypothetical protein